MSPMTSRRMTIAAVIPLSAALMVAMTTAALADERVVEAGPVAETVLPDPLSRGFHEPAVIQEVKLGLAAIQEPGSAGDAPDAGTARAAEEIEIRGQLFYPADRTKPSPLLVLVHGNHGSCDSGLNSAALTCAEFKRNEAGYAYLGENLATWGYTTFSVSQDQLMMRQDNPKGKGMHQRRQLIAATLDALGAANADGGLPVDEHTTIGTTLVGKLDMTRIGLMGHSRGGDAVTSFIDYNRIRTDGPRYPLRGVISLAPVDYERKAPYGTPYMTILPWCDGDVSNLQGARFFERSQYINGDDPFPRIQSSQLGANHNWFNTVWFADGQDGTNTADAACGNSTPSSATNVQPNNLRLSGAASYDPPSYVIDNSEPYNPLVNTKISGDPARMGDQEKVGLATMAAFFRRYVGGEGAFEPYMTGELSDTESHLQIPESACPVSESGIRISCKERVSTSYFPAATERVDVIRPEIENPLTLNALGGTLSGSGFAYPYPDNGGVTPPTATAGGYDWCNPEPLHFAPSQLGITGFPAAAKPCPLPGPTALGGQSATRENSPVNHSYGRQLALAWEPGRVATLTAQIPAASKDMSGLKALALGADVNFFDPRNPGGERTDASGAALPVTWSPEATTQDFVIALRDTQGREATVQAGDERWGNALHMSTGTVTSRTHIVLDQIRVPLSEFAAQGVDTRSLAAVEFRFGQAGMPQSGSIQLADVRFQESTSPRSLVLSDGTAPDQGAGYGPVRRGPDPARILGSYDNTPGEVELPDTVADPDSATTWHVDDDLVECPSAGFTSIQQAVDHASPWDTIVVCDGIYEESSTPVNGPGSPAAVGSANGLTITKPLKIKGAGADKVTIMPDQALPSLAGEMPYLRDGGGNVITVSRQSLGSTDTNEMFVDISGVTVVSGTTWAEAGVAFFGASGRVSESVVGPLRTATTPEELAAHPHGWGVVRTGLILGSGSGTVESEVTVSNSRITGYQAGGVLFDGARGVDASPDNIVRTGIEIDGYVSDTVVEGTENDLFAQTGVAFTSGVSGFVADSRITGHDSGADPAQSAAILLADAGTESPGGVAVTRSVLSGNAYAVNNVDATRTRVREAAPVTVSGSYVGESALSGPDSGGAASVVTENPVSRAASLRRYVPTAEGAVLDRAPRAVVIEPGATIVTAGETIQPVVRAQDDLGVRSVALLVDGELVGVSAVSPYVFSWTPEGAGPRDKGRWNRGWNGLVRIQAVVTDSAGRTTVSPSQWVRVRR